MKYIYMDESGDLGFDLTKKGTSRFFSMTFLVVDDIDVFNKPVKKIFRSFRPKKAKRLGGVLHAHKLDDTERRKVFEKIENVDFTMYTIILDKQKIFLDPQSTTQFLYATLANKLLEYLHKYSNITFIASRIYTNKTHIHEFKDYLMNNVREGVDLHVEVGTAHTYKGLQIADACSRSIHRKYEFSDHRWYDLLKNNIVGEYVVLS